MPETMTKKRSREARRAARRELYEAQILDAAEEVFASHGLDTASVQQLAAAAEVSLSTFYNTFKSKDLLLRKLHARRLGALMQSISLTMLEERSPLERLRQGIRAYLMFHMAHPDYLRMHLREGTAWAVTDDLRTPEQTRIWQAGLQMLVEACREAITRGEVLDSDPELIARTAVAMHQVRLALWVRRGMQETPEVVADDVDALFLRTFGVQD